MFCSKSLLSYKQATTLGCSFLATKAGKSTALQKSHLQKLIDFNRDSKHLYGGLLESQAERKRTIKRAKTDLLKSAAHTKDNTLVSDEVPGKTLKRRSKKKSLAILKVDYDKNMEEDVIAKEVKMAENSGIENENGDDQPGVLNRRKRLSSEEDVDKPVRKKSASLVKDKLRKKKKKEVTESASSSDEESMADRIKPKKSLANKKSVTSEVISLVSSEDVSESRPGEKLTNSCRFETDASQFPLVNELKSNLTTQNLIVNLNYTSVNRKLFSNIPSVGNILQETMSEYAKAALEKWKRDKIAELGEEGFEKLSKANLERGTIFHECIKNFMLGENSGEESSDVVKTYLSSLSKILGKLSKVAVVESHVVHPTLNYRGFVDCVAEYNGKLVVIDWKLTDKPKQYISQTYDAPLQICAYIGALNYDNNYNISVQNGLLVVANTDGSPANVFFMPEKLCQDYWTRWYVRLRRFNEERKQIEIESAS